MGKNKKKGAFKMCYCAVPIFVSFCRYRTLLLLLLLLYFNTVPQASQAELMVMTVSEIVHSLVEAHEQGIDVNLNRFV